MLSWRIYHCSSHQKNLRPFHSFNTPDSSQASPWGDSHHTSHKWSHSYRSRQHIYSLTQYQVYEWVSCVLPDTVVSRHAMHESLYVHTALLREELGGGGVCFATIPDWQKVYVCQRSQVLPDRQGISIDC